MHPHSGIATHTTLLEGSLTYEDSTRQGRPPGA
jgi:redox-sensitive bicupin YhaK (pirin superfamily)